MATQQTLEKEKEIALSESGPRQRGRSPNIQNEREREKSKNYQIQALTKMIPMLLTPSVTILDLKNINRQRNEELN